MEQNNWLEQMTRQNLKEQLVKTNGYTGQFGLILKEEDLELLAVERVETLKKEQRIEFGVGVLPKIIDAFCESAYITQENYCDTLIRLQEIFYMYKNEMLDEITDDELITFMSEQFEQVCFGDLDYLAETCLDIFAQAVRAGYRGYISSAGHGEYAKMDIVKRWDRELYLEKLRELSGE